MCVSLGMYFMSFKFDISLTSIFAYRLQYRVISDCAMTRLNCISLRLLKIIVQDCFDGLVQERRNSIANALELRLSCINPAICTKDSQVTVLVAAWIYHQMSPDTPHISPRITTGTEFLWSRYGQCVLDWPLGHARIQFIPRSEVQWVCSICLFELFI